jgi:hypothetical protein
MAETELCAGTSSDLIDWRCRQLLINGFSQALAKTATDERFDLHALIELAEAGCPPALAIRILAPLEALS